MRGSVALLFTDHSEKEVTKLLAKYEEPDYAKAGVKATFTVFLPKGTEALKDYGHGLEPYLRGLGLPTKLNMQKIELLADTFVCRQDEVLSVEQAKILKLLGHKMSNFKLGMLASRDSKGKFKHTDAGTQYLAKLGDAVE